MVTGLGYYGPNAAHGGVWSTYSTMPTLSFLEHRMVSSPVASNGLGLRPSGALTIALNIHTVVLNIHTPQP
eukprot:3238391-Pyramimonas_sp.AAC.2